MILYFEAHTETRDHVGNGIHWHWVYSTKVAPFRVVVSWCRFKNMRFDICIGETLENLDTGDSNYKASTILRTLVLKTAEKAGRMQ